MRNRYWLDSEFVVKKALLDKPDEKLLVTDLTEFTDLFITGLKVP